MKHVYVIAEAGVNHNGSQALAYELVEKAAQAGADAVKFQTFRAGSLVTLEAPKAKYQTSNSKGRTQYEMLKALELERQTYFELAKFATSIGIQFLSTGFDFESIQLLSQMNLPIYKIPSGEINNYPLLVEIAKLRKPTLVSTGMSTIQEIQDCLAVLTSNGLQKSQISILHCNTQYPTPTEDINLNAMLTIQKEFPDCKIGYSDHSLGIEVPIVAAALGATVIEKHFTLDKMMEGPDHAASLNPTELTAMIDGIRKIEVALGHGRKTPSPSETPNIAVARRSIVAAKPIQRGEVFSQDNLTTKRPGTGRNPMDWPDIIGSVAHRDYEPDEMID